MKKNKDILSKNVINSYLPPSVFEIIITDETDSTNSLAREHAENGAPEGFLVIANKQTAGRGRMGRTFHSPENTGLYMSLVLRPKLSPSDTLFITCAAAVAVSRAIDEISGKKTGIKWVNDIYFEDKKLCGILTEAAFSNDNQSLKYAVLGIGINVYEPDGGFADEIKEIAGAVFSAEEERENIKNKIAASVISTFWDLYKKIESREFLKEYKERSVILGKRVDVLKADTPKNAVVLSIDDNCRLLVQYDSGEKEYLSSGEVSIRKNTTK